MLPLSVFRSYYGLGDAFPSSQLLTRSVAGKKRNVYLTSRLVKELLQRNELHVKVSWNIYIMPNSNMICI